MDLHTLSVRMPDGVAPKKSHLIESDGLGARRGAAQQRVVGEGGVQAPVLVRHHRGRKTERKKKLRC
jgi:hypothetical protein